MSTPRDHHVVPQFFLRNFASDEGRTKVTTLSKDGAFAIWQERSIKSIGYERDFYVHMGAAALSRLRRTSTVRSRHR